MKSTKPRGYRTGCACTGCGNTEVFSTPEKGKDWMCEECTEARCKHGTPRWDWMPSPLDPGDP